MKDKTLYMNMTGKKPYRQEDYPSLVFSSPDNNFEKIRNGKLPLEWVE